MSKNAAKLKRQAAWATFETILSEDQLMQMIKMVDTQHVGNDMASLISFINRVGDTFSIDPKIRKTLYPKYFEYLNTPGIELPEDPLTTHQVGSVNDPLQALKKEAKNDPDVHGQAANKSQFGDDNPEMAVFTYFIERLLHHYPLERKDLLEETVYLSKKEKNLSDLEKEEISYWLANPEQYQWSFMLEEKAMSTLIHLVYVILCDVLGPVDADKLYHQVLEDCKVLPASKKFSPTRFL